MLTSGTIWLSSSGWVQAGTQLPSSGQDVNRTFGAAGSESSSRELPQDWMSTGPLKQRHSTGLPPRLAGGQNLLLVAACAAAAAAGCLSVLLSLQEHCTGLPLRVASGHDSRF